MSTAPGELSISMMRAIYRMLGIALDIEKKRVPGM